MFLTKIQIPIKLIIYIFLGFIGFHDNDFGIEDKVLTFSGFSWRLR